MAAAAGLDPNPDHPEHRYDWRGAWKAGARAVTDPNDGLPHWPSQFKDDDHPTRFQDGVDTKRGGSEPAPAAPTPAPSRPGGAIPLTDYLRQMAAGPAAQSPVSSEEQAEGARAVLQGLEGPTEVPAGTRAYLPPTLSDAEPIHRQIEGDVERFPEHFISDPNAQAIPRPGEGETPRARAAREGRGRTLRTFAREPAS